MRRLCQFIIALGASSLCAAQTSPLTLPVGGLKAGAVVNFSSETTLREPDGPRGQYKHGFRVLNDCAADWQKFYGARFEVKLPDARLVELTATIQRAPRGATPETPVSGTVRVSGKGWHTVTLPWPAFGFEQANTAFLKYVKDLKIADDEYKSATPAEPDDENQPAFVRADLSGADAIRFKAVIGGDYPPGDESQRRKVTAIRAPRGDQARFLTLTNLTKTNPP